MKTLAPSKQPPGPDSTLQLNPLKAIRLRRRLAQERLAVLSGLSRGWVGFLERNPESMTPSAAEKLAAALECDPADLHPRREP